MVATELSGFGRRESKASCWLGVHRRLNLLQFCISLSIAMSDTAPMTDIVHRNHHGT
jgi:hypothetical protein